MRVHRYPRRMRLWLTIGVGGALGALARWSIGELVLAVADSPTFPWGTLIANVVGCFAIGVLAPIVVRHAAWVSGLVVTGFLGGFTTYSAFAEEAFALVDRGDAVGVGLAAVYVLVTVEASAIAAAPDGRIAGERLAERAASRGASR